MDGGAGWLAVRGWQTLRIAREFHLISATTHPCCWRCGVDGGAGVAGGAGWMVVRGGGQFRDEITGCEIPCG